MNSVLASRETRRKTTRYRVSGFICIPSSCCGRTPSLLCLAPITTVRLGL
jgi:hypothetical protein